MNQDEMKDVVRAAQRRSGASDQDFMAAMLGVLSTVVDPVVWVESATFAADCFRDRK